MKLKSLFHKLGLWIPILINTTSISTSLGIVLQPAKGEKSLKLVAPS